jgi:hypothetical protein
LVSNRKDVVIVFASSLVIDAQEHHVAQDACVDHRVEVFVVNQIIDLASAEVIRSFAFNRWIGFNHESLYSNPLLLLNFEVA